MERVAYHVIRTKYPLNPTNHHGYLPLYSRRAKKACFDYSVGMDSGCDSMDVDSELEEVEGSSAAPQP